MAPYLYHAARNGAWRTVGEQPNRKQASYVASDGKTALHWVCSFSHFPANIVLALHDAFPPAALISDSIGHVPLHIAYMGASPSVVATLKDVCPSAETARNRWGWTPSMMTTLVDAGVTCEEVMGDNEGRAPSYYFFKKANDELMAKLDVIDLGGSPLEFLGGNEHLTEIYGKARLLLEMEMRALEGLGELSSLNTIDNTSRCTFLILHATLRVSSCPWSFFHLSLRLNPEQVRQLDSQGELPLHLAAEAKSLWDNEFFTCSGCFMGLGRGSRFHYGANRSQVYCARCVEDNEDNMLNYQECQTCEKGPAAIQELLALYPAASRIPNSQGRLALNIALDNDKYWNTGVKSLFEIAPESIEVRDVWTHMFPFMIGAVVAATTDDRQQSSSLSSSSLLCSRNQQTSGKEFLDKFTTIYSLLMEAPHLLDSRFRRRNINSLCGT